VPPPPFVPAPTERAPRRRTARLLAAALGTGWAATLAACLWLLIR
jgi:hypothetical protein